MDPRPQTVTVARARPRGRRAVAGVAILAAGAMLAILAAQSGAQTVDELNAQIASAQSKAQSLGAEIDAKGAQLSAARSQAAAAAAREAELSAVLARGEQRQAELEVEVQRTETHLARARAHLHRALDKLEARLVSIYKGDSPDATELLLSARGFDDLANGGFMAS